MKLKNVNFIERHVEKFVLGIFALIALVIVWIYLMGNPYAVELSADSRRRTLQPDEVEEFVLEQAEALDQLARSDRNPLPEMPVPAYTENFQRRFRQRVVDAKRFEVPPGLPGIEGFEIAPPGMVEYLVPQPPAVTDLAVRSGYAVLAEPESPDRLEAYEELIGDERPLDFRYVSVGATFSFQEWRRRLRATPNPGLARIPEDWWRGLQAITDVRLERQEWDPAAGDWSEETVLVATLPGDVSVRSVPSPIPPDRAEYYVLKIKQEQAEIVRPKFPAIKAGRPWLPPDSALEQVNLSPAEQRRYYELTRQIRQIEQQLHEREQQGEAAEPADGGWMGPGAGEGLAPGARDRGPSRRVAERRENRVGGPVKLDQQLESLRQERNELLGRTGEQVAESSFSENERPASSAGGDGEDFTIDEVALWSHDMTVEPGKRYRYRVRVGLINPLFRRAELAPEQREKYLDQLVLDSAVSGWSEPVELDPLHYFFVTESNQQQRRATVEVWRVFDGRWRRREFTVAPGDPIGGVVPFSVGDLEMEVDLGVGAVAVDIIFDVTSSSTLSDRTARLLYQEVDRGRLSQRAVADDLQSEVRFRLQAEALNASPAVDAGSGGFRAAAR